MQPPEDSIKLISSSLNAIIESIQPAVNDMKTLFEQLVPTTQMTQLNEIHEKIPEVFCKIKNALNKLKKFRHIYTKIISKEKQAIKLSQSSLKIKKIKEKKHIINELNKCKNLN